MSDGTNPKDGYTLHLEECFAKALERNSEAYDRLHAMHSSIAPMAAEIDRLREFVQFVADCTNDPRVRDEAIKMGAKP